MHVIPLQGKEIMHLISDLFLEFKFFDEKKISELVGCFDSSASVAHTSLFMYLYVQTESYCHNIFMILRRKKNQLKRLKI